MAAKTFKMTAAGKAELEAELEQLKTEGRIDIAEKLKVARSYGDLSENSEYDEAKSEQAKIEARINELEYQLDHAVVVESTDKNTVSVGSTVTVIRKSDNAEITYQIVGFSESNPAQGKISEESPVGMGLIGAKIGETVTIEAPIGNLDFEIKDIQLNK
jgi:transcription elongation factor GreA